MVTGEKYKIKYCGELIEATCIKDESVKELFFRTDSGELIMQFEIDEIIEFSNEK